MIDLVRFDDPQMRGFAERFSIEPLVFSGEGVLACGTVRLLDATRSSNKSLPSLLTKHRPDLVFGCEWTRPNGHMDYPSGAMRIQTARAIRDASAMYVITPRVLERDRLEVALFDAKVLRRAGVPVVFASLAERPEELASVKDLNAIGRLLGFSDEEIARSRSLIEKLPSVRFEQSFAVELSR